VPTATPTKAKSVLPVGMPSTDQARIINDAFEAAKVRTYSSDCLDRAYVRLTFAAAF